MVILRSLPIFQGLSSDVLIAYFTRNDPAVTAAVWNAQLFGAAKVNPAAQQFFCLKDCKAAAFVLEYPRDNVSFFYWENNTQARGGRKSFFLTLPAPPPPAPTILQSKITRHILMHYTFFDRIAFLTLQL